MGAGGNTATVKTFFSAGTRKRYYRIPLSVPPNPQTHNPPRGMHVVVVGRAQAPPPWRPPTRPKSPPTPPSRPPHNYPLPPPPPSFDR